MQHFFGASVLLLALIVCDASWHPRRLEPIMLTESAGSLTFNSSLEPAPVTYREWILCPPPANPNGRPPLLRIFVEEIQLETPDGDQCPTNKRITIGNADKPDNEDSVAYCKHLRNFEISVMAHRVYIRLQCPPGEDGPVYFQLHYGLVVPSEKQETGLQRPGRQVCRDPFHDKVSDGLHSHLWACRPVFYGHLSETQCLTTDQICNGFEDCPSGEDESPATCNKQTATVIETIHSLSSWLNTTQSNWPVSADINAPGKLLNIALHPCHPGEFQCKVQNHEEDSQTNFVCISSAWVCDGHDDCPDGEDETPELCSHQKPPVEGCPPHTFPCSYDAKCLDQRFICDGTQDCFGSKDESAAACAWKKEHRLPTTPDDYQQNITHTKDIQIDKYGIHANMTVSVSIEWGLVNRLCPPQKPYLCRYSQTCLPLSALCNGKVECPDQLDESVLVCALFESIKSAMQNATTEVVAPPSTPDTCHGAAHTYPWIAGVYSRQCFLCYGVLISGANASWWVLVPAPCGNYLPPKNLTIIPEKSSEPYRVDSREDQPNLQNASSNIPAGFSLLKIDLSTLPATNATTNVTSALSSLGGFNFTTTLNETTGSTCELITPVRCQPPLVDGERFALQHVQLSNLSVCQQRYPHFPGFSTPGLVCVPQEICLQHNLGAILVCKGTAENTSKRLGFALHGADCAPGQLGWPAIVSTTTEQTTAWIEVAIGNRQAPTPPAMEALCGYAPDGRFPWFVYFNMRAGRSYCLGIYVENKTFPLITSQRCLTLCLRANGLQQDCNLEPVGLPAISWLKQQPEEVLEAASLSVQRRETEMNVCPAKYVHERLANVTPEQPVWTQCTLAYLHNSTSKAIGIERINVQPFTACQGEDFYLALRDKMLLCVLATSEQPLNCQHWTDATLVTCQRASTLQWELVGLAPACRSNSAFKWFLRVLPW